LCRSLASLLDAAEKATALQSALLLAQHEKAEAERQLRQRAMYELYEVRPGAFVLRPKPALHGVQPPKHYLCANCHAKGVESFLRFEDGGGSFAHELRCPEVREHSIAHVPPLT
jgi:hypothetical protein